MIHKANPEWGTHIPLLIKLLEHTEGPVLELGMGISSTPLLHALCQNRKLVSYENDPIFTEMFKKYQTANHDIRLVTDWDDAELNHLWSVALIDHKPDARRKEEIKRLRWFCDYLIVHDTQPEVNDLYRYDEIYRYFPYQYTDTSNSTHTTVLSLWHALDFLHNP